jgi:hypothetical protein
MKNNYKPEHNKQHRACGFTLPVCISVSAGRAEHVNPVLVETKY